MKEAAENPHENIAASEDDELPETDQFRCPLCTSDEVERIGLEHAIDFGPLRAVHRCLACCATFVFMRPRRR